MKLLHFLGAVAVVAGLASCTADKIDGNNSASMSAGTKAFTIQLVASESETDGANLRSVTNVVDPKVEDVWVLQFAGGTDNSRLVTDATYVKTPNNVATVNLMPNSGYNRIFFLANTHDATLFANAKAGGILTPADLLSMSKQLEKESDAAVSGKSVLMNAIFEGPLSDDNKLLLVPIKRNYARVTLNLSNELYGVTLTSLRLRNVPKHVDYFTPATLPDVYPAASEDGFIDYDAETLPTGKSATYVWYLPTNKRGSNDAITDSKDKYSENAPDANCTYVEIKGKTADDVEYTFSFYLGANNINDFNLLAGTNYTLNLGLFEVQEDDNRVFTKEPARSKLPYANTIMMDPSATAATHEYAINVTSLPNIFYGNKWAAKKSLIIGDNTDWTVDVVMYTEPDLVTLKTASGKGAAADAVVTVNNTGKVGSVILGLKSSASADKYLWYYHLWVTPYNPGKPTVGQNLMVAPMVVDGYKKEVPGGHIHRYKSSDNHVVMDRNLGASSMEHVTGGNFKSFGGFYIQGFPWPFFSDQSAAVQIPVYNAQGTAMTRTYTAAVDAVTAIQDYANYKYPGVGPKAGSWTTDSFAGDCWNSITKTIMDPCPEGWQVAANEDYTNFTTTVGATLDDTGAPGTFLYNTTYKTRVYNPEGVTGMDAEYPLAGYMDCRVEKNGAHAGSYQWIYIGTANNTATGRQYVSCGRGTVAMSRSNQYGHSFGLPVRCVSLKYNF